MDCLGVASAYTANLPTTKAIFKAVRAARACQQGIRSEQQPSQLWAEPLPQIRPNHCRAVTHLRFSPDATHCVVGYCQIPFMAGTRTEDYQAITHDVALYETHTGAFRRFLRSRDPGWYDVIRWSPCSAQLTVYCSKGQQFEVYDVATQKSVVVPWTPAAHSHRWVHSGA